MKIPVVKKLVETYDLQELQTAENALLEEQQPAIDIEGEDEGEQLTHVIAAMEILRDMQKNGLAFREAMRNYTQRVRNSIS